MIDQLLANLGRQALSQPWALTPDMESAASIIWGLRIIDDSAVSPVVQSLVGLLSLSQLSAKPGNAQPDDESEDNVAVVPIRGLLMRSTNFLQRFMGATSYGSIQARFEKAMASDAKTVLLAIDSPGGDVVGCDATAQLIADGVKSSKKRVIAYTSGQMCSAAYWIGSQADEVISTRDAQVGSIGVIAKIVDTTRADKNKGADSTILTTGENKGIGATPITGSHLGVLNDIMAETFANFVAAVEAGRGKPLSDDAKTGRFYTGSSAMKVGLVDKNMSLAQLMKECNA